MNSAIDAQLAGKTVFLTGATGFIGSRLAERLVRLNCNVKALVRSTSDRTTLPATGITIVTGDLLNYSSVAQAMTGCEVGIHCAAATARHVHGGADLVDVNVVGTQNVARAATVQRLQHLVHVSTTGVHGKAAKLPADEDARLAPNTAYRQSKLEGEKIITRQIAQNGLKATIVRLTPVYGPGAQRWRRLIRDISRGRILMIGDGNHPFHLTYVDDAVEGIIRCLANSQRQYNCYCIASDRINNLREFYHAIAQKLGVQFYPRQYPAMPFRIAYPWLQLWLRAGVEIPLAHQIDFFLNPRWYSTERAMKELGYRPTVSLEEGVGRMVSWFQSTQGADHHDR